MYRVWVVLESKPNNLFTYGVLFLWYLLQLTEYAVRSMPCRIHVHSDIKDALYPYNDREMPVSPGALGC